jgi:hypothetical protein
VEAVLGIRLIDFDNENGFTLNGGRVKINVSVYAMTGAV